MKPEVFRFKQFSVSHSISSMKVGVDAVLLGAWSEMEGRRMLDVGTGCGIIALMMAQRFPSAEILAVDIHEDSINEAGNNFENSPYSDRLSARHMEFPADLLKSSGKFDLIVSNPPFYDSGISSPSTPRLKARHQDSLSIFSLLKNAHALLKPSGSLSVIFPSEHLCKALETARLYDMNPSRCCLVRNNPSLPFKRAMMQFVYEPNESNLTICEFQRLTLFEKGEPTPEYKMLCRDFYLKF